MNLEKCSPAIPEIIVGEDKALTVQLEDKKTREFINLTGVSEIVALLANMDGTVLQKKLTEDGIIMLSPLAGKFQIILAAEETLLLALSPAGGLSSIEIRFTLSDKLTIVKLTNSILITPKLFPSV